MIRKLKITIIAASMNAGGAERVISQLLSDWEKEGYELSLILLDKKEKFYSISENIPIIEIGQQSNNRVIDKIKRYQQVRKAVMSISPDIILSLPEEIGIYVLWALRHTKIPVVVSERNDPQKMPNKKITRFMRKLMYPHAAGLIFQTEAAASFFSEKIRQKGIVLPNPLDLSRIPDVWSGEREKLIVSAGRLEPQKNFPLLIEAFSLFYKSHQDYRLIIYGDGSQREKLQVLIDSKGLADVIKLPGVSNTLLEDIYKASMFVLSSDYEGVPNVLIEAMAAGIPCVSTDCEPGGAASIITNDTCGVLIPIGDIEALLDTMEKVEREKIGLDALEETSEIIKGRYCSEKVSREWAEYLEELVGRKVI